jgi:hypothetical protein
MDKPMRCQCGRPRTIALDKYFRTVLHCVKCDEIERAEPVKSLETVPAAQ